MRVPYLCGFGEEFGFTGLLGLLLSLEEGVIDLRNINSLEIDLCACGQSVSLVHSLEGDTVDLVWASNEEKTGWELLEEDDTSATESSGKEDEDATWDNAPSELSSLGALSRLLVVLAFIVSGVPCELLYHFRYLYSN